MSSNIKIPKFCQFCGQAFVAQTTTTRYCSKTCNSRHYKQKKREEKVQAALQQEMNTPSQMEQMQTLQTLPIKVGNHVNLREKEFLSVQEAADLVGASRWTIQRMIKREQIKVGKLGRRTIIPRTEIDNLFK
ncbi:MAG: helix-turn-helix domain-containing protein [Flavobacteriales bacterium]|nr:helix-turn-helix domain-containing protein [Flavobacteriales bacterium]